MIFKLFRKGGIMKKLALVSDVINKTITNRFGLIMKLLGAFVLVTTFIMIVADKMATYISGTITLVAYLLLVIRYILNRNSKQKEKLKM